MDLSHQSECLTRSQPYCSRASLTAATKRVITHSAIVRESASCLRSWARMRRRVYSTRWRRTRPGLSESNGIDAPALAGDAAIASHPPAQHKGGASREPDRSLDKPARVAGPCLSTSERIAAATTDRTIVTAGNKAAKRKNVLKRISTVRTDFQ